MNTPIIYMLSELEYNKGYIKGLMYSIDNRCIHEDSNNKKLSDLRQESDKFAKEKLIINKEIQNVKDMYKENIIDNEAIAVAFFNMYTYGVESLSTLQTLYFYITNQHLTLIDKLVISTLIIHSILLVIYPNLRKEHFRICKECTTKLLRKIYNGIDMRKYQ